MLELQLIEKLMVNTLIVLVLYLGKSYYTTDRGNFQAKNRHCTKHLEN